MNGFRQELWENGYARQEELTFADCDCRQRARVSTLLSRAAIYAGYDYNARGLTHDRLWSMREVFLLSRVALRIHRCPMARDVLETSTWENGVRGAHMQRVYEMRDQAGELCVSVKSEWILVDPETRRILRPETFTAKKLGICGRPIDCPDPRKILLPKTGAEDSGRASGLSSVTGAELSGRGEALFSTTGAEDSGAGVLPPPQAVRVVKVRAPARARAMKR